MSENLRATGLLHRFLVCAFAICGALSAALFCSTTAFAICVPTAYTVTSIAPPTTANWTDTSGSVWTPAGGFPGCAPGDSATDVNASPTTLIVNSVIPNALIGLNLACNGCVIDMQPGASMTIAGPATIGSGAQENLGGGALTIANGGALTFQTGATLNVLSGSLDTQSGGHTTLPDAVTTTASGGNFDVEGTLTVPAAATLQMLGGVTLTLNGGTVDGGGALDNAGLLQGQGTLNVNLTNDALVEPGIGAVGTLSGSNLTWNGGGAINFQLGATGNAADTDSLALSGTLTKGSGSSFVFHFGDGNGAPTVGTAYTLITFAGSSGFVAADFSYDYTGTLAGLTGTFTLSQSALTFTPSALPVRLQSFVVD